MRRELEREILPFEVVRRQATGIDGWVRSLRRATGFPAGEMARRMGVRKREIFRLELAEKNGRIDIGRLRQLADTLDCELTYAFVPKQTSLEELAERERSKRKRARESKRLEKASQRYDGMSGVEALRLEVGRLVRRLGIRIGENRRTRDKDQGSGWGNEIHW